MRGLLTELSKIFRELEARLFPALVKAGWLRPLKKGAKPPQRAQTGRFVQPSDESVVEPTTPSAPFRWLRDIFLTSRPPRLDQGGESSLAESWSPTPLSFQDPRLF